MSHELIQEISNIARGGQMSPELMGSLIRTIQSFPIPFDELKNNSIPPSTPRIVNTLISARDNELPELSQELEDLRTIRLAGQEGHQKAQLSKSLDEAVLGLILENENDLASALISSSPQDATRLRNTVAELEYDRTDREAISTQLTAIQTAKQRKLGYGLILKGASQDTYQTLLKNSYDPNLELQGCESDWQLYDYERLPKPFKDVIRPDELTGAIPALKSILKHGMVADAADIFETCRKITLPADRDIYLRNAKKFLEKLDTSGDITIETDWFKGYLNPLDAYNASQQICSDILEGVVLLDLAYKPFKDRGDTVVTANISDEAVDLLSELQVLLSKSGMTVLDTESMLVSIDGRESPEEYLKVVTGAIKACEGLNPETYAYPLSFISDEGKFEKAAESIQLLRDHFSFASSDLMHSMLVRVMTHGYRKDVLATAQELIAAEELITENLEAIIDADGYDPITLAYEQQTDTAISIDTLCLVAKYNFEMLLMATCKNIDLSDQQTDALKESWQTFNAYNNLRQRVGTEIPDSYLKRLAESKYPQGYIQQWLALTDYIHTYGPEETREQITSFGIHNFIRYEPEQLHAQYEMWHDASRPLTNIIISSQGDYNYGQNFGSMNHASTFGSEGLLFTEAGNPEDVARIIVKVGKRERSADREPAIDNVVLDGHGNNEAFTLKGGANKQAMISVKRLVASIAKRNKHNHRANTYHKHLGTNFRLIFMSCGIAAPRKDSTPCLAYTVHDTHGMRVDAPSDYASQFRIAEDGTVIYRNSEPLYGDSEEYAATTYPAQ